MLMAHVHREPCAGTAFDSSGVRHLRDMHVEVGDGFGRGAVLRGERPRGVPAR